MGLDETNPQPVDDFAPAPPAPPVSDAPFPGTLGSPAAMAAETTDAERAAAKAAAGEIWIVAGLSAANTLLSVFGVGTSLIFGLSSTLIASYMFDPVISVPIMLVIAGAFAGFGFFAGKGQVWAFVAALVLYAADAAAAVWAVAVVGDTSFGLDLLAHAAVTFLLVRNLVALSRARRSGLPA